MPATPKVKPYRWLATYYDEFFTPFLTPITRARDRILGPLLPRVQSACDLCCGTGTTALVLARRGITMFAVDQSPHMCRIARQKARLACLPLRVIQADMQSFRLPRPVDLITCESDALNHLPRHSDLNRVAHAVARALRSGGYFFFDVNNALGFKKYWTGASWYERPGVVMVMRSSHNRQATRAAIDVDWFIREASVWRRHSERVEQVSWTADEIRRALSAAGFSQVRSWDAAPFFNGNSPVGPGCRTVYLARKSPR
jgi:SAM-dependent methyltransferase